MGNNLKKIRKQLNMSGNVLASKVKVQPSMIYMIESGKRNPSLLLAKKIATIFGKSVDEIFFNDKGNKTLQCNKKGAKLNVTKHKTYYNDSTRSS